MSIASVPHLWLVTSTQILNDASVAPATNRSAEGEFRTTPSLLINPNPRSIPGLWTKTALLPVARNARSPTFLLMYHPPQSLRVSPSRPSSLVAVAWTCQPSRRPALLTPLPSFLLGLPTTAYWIAWTDWKP